MQQRSCASFHVEREMLDQSLSFFSCLAWEYRHHLHHRVSSRKLKPAPPDAVPASYVERTTEEKACGSIWISCAWRPVVTRIQFHWRLKKRPCSRCSPSEHLVARAADVALLHLLHSHLHRHLTQSQWNQSRNRIRPFPLETGE